MEKICLVPANFFILWVSFTCILIILLFVAQIIKTDQHMHFLTLALDWTPNINHIGFFVAQEKGFYREQGIDLNILHPGQDEYRTTPAKKVELGEADFALCPTESIISYRTKRTPFQMIAIAAILQEDLSAITIQAGNGIGTPADLDGKIYASYKARYEDELVREMIRNAGGRGDIKVTYPEKLGIWETVLKGEADSTWMFLNWEGISLAEADEQLNYFRMEDYDVPYSYSPVIAASEHLVREKGDVYRTFLEATKAGYLYCQDHEDEVVAILRPLVPPHEQAIDLHRALAASTRSFGTQLGWGRMERKKVLSFLNWLRKRNLETQPLTVSQLITNRLLS